MKTIQLPRTLANTLLAEAQKSSPNESCGLIAQKSNKHATDKKETLFRAYPIDNIAAQAKQFFEMDAHQQIAAMKNMREQNETLFGIYHSHPTSPAQPSATDWEQMNNRDVYYLIISLNTIGVLEMKAYWPEQNSFVQVGIEIN